MKDEKTNDLRLPIAHALSIVVVCLRNHDRCADKRSNRDIAFEETQQEESAEGSDSTTSENGESASEPGVRKG